MADGDGAHEKRSLRRLLLERRDNTSSDLLAIAGQRIRRRLAGLGALAGAKKIGAYYSIGSEIPTPGIIGDLLSGGREVFLPKVTGGGTMTFRRITGLSGLEMGRGRSFDIMEPKDSCPEDNDLDAILVPTVAISPAGVRLGYGYGFYDRFLGASNAVTVSLTLEKQLVRRIPSSDHDVAIDWIVTEDRTLRARRG